jgi:hypothetical protein
METRSDETLIDENGIHRVHATVTWAERTEIPKRGSTIGRRCIDINYFALWALGKRKRPLV